MGRAKIFLLGCVFLLMAAMSFMAGRLSVHRNNVAPVPDPAAALADSTPQADVAVKVRPEPVAVPVVARPSSGWDEKSWQQLLALPATLSRNADLAALLEKLAAVDPQQALALAKAEGNLKLRDTLMQSVLHGWGRLAPMDAAAYAMALPNATDRDQALKSVFAGAVITDPDAAVRTANAMMQQNPGEATGYGNSMIDTLCDSGNFEMAAKLASGGGVVQQSIWMSEAYSKWALLQPQAAAQAANEITDPAVKNEALHGVIGGWAQADPAGLAGFLAQQPAGGDRGQMLGQALESWVQLDPVATAQWINANGAQLGTDLDAGIKAVATVNAADPPTAVEWANTITDGNLRSQALNDVLRNWILTDYTAAKNFIDTTTDLLPADRQQISEIIASMSAQTSAQ